VADEYPDYLKPGRHRDVEGRSHQPWIRRAFLTLLFAVIVLALLNVFGQRSDTSRAAGAGATLEVRGPTKVRGGLLFQERVTIRAHRDIEHPRIVLGTGWVDGLQVNTIEPSPQSESSRDGRLVLSYDKLQVNPTHVGTTDMSVEFDDATVPVTSMSRQLTSFP
jgi:hypothetical protein